ncbi:hypothetical protein KJ885_03665 [Patescibacteria group bacterium]|nr:hypothetical protein [Patescibacteria group bacterium]
MNKKFVLSLSLCLGFMFFCGLALPQVALGASDCGTATKGTSLACVNSTSTCCYDRTNISQFMGIADTYDDSVGILKIKNSHNFGAKKIEFHLCGFELYSPAVITANGLQGKILINTEDGFYNNGSNSCSDRDITYVHIASKIQASGHDGWIEINADEFKMEITGYTGIGSLITSGTTGYNSLNGSNKENISVGGYGGGGYGGGGYGGGSWGGSGGGGGGTIEINSSGAISINQAISVDGGGGGAGGAWPACGAGGGGGGAGGGGIIKINTIPSINIGNNTFSAGEIYISTNNDLTIASSSILNANNGAIGKIGLEACGTMTIQGKLYAYVGASNGIINISANIVRAMTGSGIQAATNLNVFYHDSCQGLNNATHCPGAGANPILPAPFFTKLTNKPTGCAEDLNNAPYTPILLSPASPGLKDVDKCPTLQWKSGDIEGNDLTFKIYFSADKNSVKWINNSAKIKEFTAYSNADGSWTNYELSLYEAVPEQCYLMANTTYYWRVVVKDNP